MDRMLNRRTFFKTSAASPPLAAAIQTLNPATISAETIADAAISGTAPKLIPLPTRLAAVDPSTLPWQQNIRRVGQSNMTEHDPAVSTAATRLRGRPSKPPERRTPQRSNKRTSPFC
jgi:hypothetical protein